MPQRPEDLDLTAVESALRGLRPRPGAIDRDVLMYRAGRASARGWRWPAAAALSSAVALSLGVALLVRPAAVAERVVYLPAPPATGRAEEEPPPPPRGDGGSWAQYVHLQEEVLDRGLDGLPPPAAPEQPQSVESLLHSY